MYCMKRPYPLIARNEEFKEVHRYYRTRKENPLKKMQSVIAVACKSLKESFYTILTKGVTYDGAKMMQRYQETTDACGIECRSNQPEKGTKAECNGGTSTEKCCYRKQVSNNRNKE